MSMMMELLNSIFERRYTSIDTIDVGDHSIITLVDQLIGTAGESSGLALSNKVLDCYEHLNEEEKMCFFNHLANEMDIDADRAENALVEYAKNPSKKTYSHYMASIEPARQELIRRLNQVPGATGRLVGMREDLSKYVKESDTLAALDLDFKHLFTSWFNRGFLVLRPINWETPAHILEKIIAYEAVHAIDSWDDLRRRMLPKDRYCFAFFHPSMPDEPLIFVEVALIKGEANSVPRILSENREEIPANEADTAVFYSISNCQRGLDGISFGSLLIKQVVTDLSDQFSNIKKFVTLSPIPSLMSWAKSNGIDTNISPFDDLKSLVAYYLLYEKLSDGKPFDRVARFHLGNGARIHAIHTSADTSNKGFKQSGGVMVNYLYNLKDISTNHEKFTEKSFVAAERAIHKLAEQIQPIIKENSNA